MISAVRRLWDRLGYGPYALEEAATGSVLSLGDRWYPKE